MTKKVVVTGGAGFIGSHTVEGFLQKGYRVCVIDNLSTGRLANLEALLNDANFEFINADINDTAKTAKAFVGADIVVHLAALADIVPSIENPLEYHRANVGGTVAVLEQCRNARVGRFVYAASSSCYGIPKIYPTPENAEASPQYPYALTKFVGEQYVMHWSKIYRIPAISLRLFNVYGPRSRTSGTYGAVFGVFLAQRLNGLPYTVVGDGEQSRDFTYVKDVANAFITASESNVAGEIFNVGSGSHYSINKLVSLLGGEKTHIPKRPGEPDVTHADTTKIKSILSWRPNTSFEAGVSEMLRHIENWRDAPVWTPEKIEKATSAWFTYLSK